MSDPWAKAERIHIPQQYQGHTYPGIFANAVARWLWKRLCCPRWWHLWDERMSSFDHTMTCDACDVRFGEVDDSSYGIAYYEPLTGKQRPESEWPK